MIVCYKTYVEPPAHHGAVRLAVEGPCGVIDLGITDAEEASYNKAYTSSATEEDRELVRRLDEELAKRKTYYYRVEIEDLDYKVFPSGWENWVRTLKPLHGKKTELYIEASAKNTIVSLAWSAEERSAIKADLRRKYDPDNSGAGYGMNV